LNILRKNWPNHTVNHEDIEMNEIQDILNKYEKVDIKDSTKSLESLNSFAFNFYTDVAEIYDSFTRIKNTERNKSGYSLNDAPIIALLVKTWKLLKEIIIYYKKNNAEIISVLERPLIECAITATYLMKSDQSVIEDYRKCSYKDRLRILQDHKNNSSFFETKPGKRVLKSVIEKMQLEGLTTDDFKKQKANKWRLQGKSFFDIFKEVEHEDLYRYTFGMMSESIHCSWNDSMDWCLQNNDDDTFDIFPFYHPADVRYVTPTLHFLDKPYRLWLHRIGVDEKYFFDVLDWIVNINNTLYVSFDQLYDE